VTFIEHNYEQYDQNGIAPPAFRAARGRRGENSRCSLISATPKPQIPTEAHSLVPRPDG
jgi:hypothetical protein